MKAIELNMPDEIYRKLESLGAQDQQSVNAFALRKLEEYASAFKDLKELVRRGRGGNREEFLMAMPKVPDATPMTGDEL
jgi:hypothetical protein